MADILIKIFGFLIEFFLPGKVNELQLKISRLDISNPTEIEDFINLYEETFPDDGSNYTAEVFLEALEDIHNVNKHIAADNIILIAKYKDKIVGFTACFYYPQKKYGIIGYLGRTNSINKVGSHISIKLLKKLKSILVKEHDCKLLVFELEKQKRDKAKVYLFRSYAKKLGLRAFELMFDYWRPKLNLDDSKEDNLRLLILPINKTINNTMAKTEVLNILDFIYFDCYGDYYDEKDEKFQTFHDYLKNRIDFYKLSLPDTIKLK